MKAILNKLKLATAAILLFSQAGLARSSAAPHSSMASVDISCEALNDNLNPKLNGLKNSKVEFSKGTAVYDFHFKPSFEGHKQAKITYISLQSALKKVGERPVKALFLKEKNFKMLQIPGAKRSYVYRGMNVLEARFALKKAAQNDKDFYKTDDFEADQFDGLTAPDYMMTIKVDEGQNFNDYRKPHRAFATLTIPARKDDIGRILSEPRDLVHFRCQVRGI